MSRSVSAAALVGVLGLGLVAAAAGPAGAAPVGTAPVVSIVAPVLTSP